MRPNKSMMDHYRVLADQYMRKNGLQTVEVSEVVEWAMRKGKLSLSQDFLFKVHMACMSSSLREDTTKDMYGRKVRLRHCLTTTTQDDEWHPVQKTFWAHIDEAPDEFLLASLIQRKKAIAADLDSLKADLEFINLRREQAGKRAIQLNLPEMDWDGEE